MSIALLCPSRERPEQLKRMIESMSNTAITSMPTVFLALNSDDAVIYQEVYGIRVFIMIVPDNMPTAHKWNLLAQEAMKMGHKLFMLAADDMVFATKGWDKGLLDDYEKLENKIHIYAFQDSRDESGTPHIIATKEYIEVMNYFVPPYFLHWQIDTWTVEIAKANNCFTHLKDYLLIHDKPSDKGEGDETHNRIRQWGWRERDAYVVDKCSYVLEFEKNRLAEKIDG